ncbi:MAG: type II toxin-antitoxin system VapC family toxin [Oscillatoria sp. SIO1A7]|nr:type II toxin-antitoxin system VapC family toxin [Oscillatoria sp. SIO1A7]
MEWIDRLEGQIVGLDTAPLIYFIEGHHIYVDTMRLFFRAMNRGDFTVVTSILTLVETLVYPLRQDNITLTQQYRDILFNGEGLTTVEVFEDIAETAARLRADYNLRTPDAIQMATAIRRGASFFLTNDTRLPSLPGLELLVLDELIGA